MKLLVFRLEGPLQSWGERSRWDHRDTALMPTKSGIVGLLGGCLGYPRGDERLSSLSGALRVAVRADRPGRIMEDYHTVTGTDGVLLNAQRKKRSGNGTIITPRQYLQGAAFQVFLAGDDQVLMMCERAMRRPHWPPFLGRKSCPPAIPLLPHMLDYPTIEDAVRDYPVSWRDARPGGVLQAEIECGAEDGACTGIIRVRPDEVVDAARDQYLDRRVYVDSVRVKEGTVCI